MPIATFTVYDPAEGPIEDFIPNFTPNLIMKYYYLFQIFENIVVNKRLHSYEKDLYNISFLSDDIIEKKLINKYNEHKINVATGSFSSSLISYPQTALYNSTISTIIAQTKTNLEEKSVKVEYKKVPKPIILAYMELLKDIENPNMKGRTKMYEKD
jgi:hypothetical protein